MGVAGLWCAGTAKIISLNDDFFRFLAQQRGARFATMAVSMQLGFYTYSGFAFGLGRLRCAAGLVQTRREIVPLEPSEEPAPEST